MSDIVKRIHSASLESPSSPWEKVAHFAIGGMRSVGFSECSKYILVETADGRGLFDCETGEKLVRDREEYPNREASLICDGIGPIEGQPVRMSGLHGGGLPLTTKDGWVIEIVNTWPKTDIVILKPGHWLHGEKYGKPHQFRKIWSGYEIRGAGFSYSGKTLLVGESSDLVIYVKKDS